MQASEIKANLNKQVSFRGSTYILTGAIFRKSDKYYYQAELTDVKQNKSIVIARLEDVEVEND